MDLILWRHADALSDESIDDAARPLTGKGRKRATTIATWLDKHLPDGARVLSSPAKRAVQTAECLCERFDRKLIVDPQLAFGADCAALLAAAGWPDNRHPVVLVGHQPAMGRLTSLLLFGEEHAFTIRKASVVWLTNRAREEVGESRETYPVTLRALMCPDFL
jgi:phosphohistidine phosphatase